MSVTRDRKLQNSGPRVTVGQREGTRGTAVPISADTTLKRTSNEAHKNVTAAATWLQGQVARTSAV